MTRGGSAAEPLRAVALVVLDSVGIGGAPDAHDFGDEGSATLPNVAEAVGGLDLPYLGSLGLGNIVPVRGVSPVSSPRGAHGAMVELSAGKDTTTGHWEMSGVVLESPFPTYPRGFPPEVINRLEAEAGIDTMGNEVASGTEIIFRLGDEHRKTGRPIVYTSADSVLQIAAHADVVPLERLYEICRIARERVMVGDHEVGRVIARPFEGEGTAADPYVRTADRHDFSVPPPRDTLLDAVRESGLEVRAVGKISDIFAGRGVTVSTPTRSNSEGLDVIAAEIGRIERGLIFANLVDFDQAYGHRNDPQGYGEALRRVDERLPEIEAALGPRDALIITADHGNDPTTASTDHSRERVPLLITGPSLTPGDLGVRESFVDLAVSVAELLGVPSGFPGTSFAPLLRA